MFADLRAGERTEAEVGARGAPEQQLGGRNQTQQAEPEAAAGNAQQVPSLCARARLGRHPQHDSSSHKSRRVILARLLALTSRLLLHARYRHSFLLVIYV